jgi:hypothetical protein
METRKMRLSIALLALLAVGVLHASGARADDAAVVAEMKAAKTALDDAFASHDKATIKAMVTPDHLAVTSFYGRPVNTDDELAVVDEFEPELSDFTDTVVKLPGPDAAQITFENSIQGNVPGQAAAAAGLRFGDLAETGRPMAAAALSGDADRRRSRLIS